MPWPGPQLRLILLPLILAVLRPPEVASKGNVGCLFSELNCKEEEEWCYNDRAFGQCLSLYDGFEEEDLYRFSLSKQELHDLSKELRRLFALGYRWGHAYTQCRLKGMLYALKTGTEFDPITCFKDSDNDLEGALRALESFDQPDPRELAIIRYTPSSANGDPQFADEIYYPPTSEDRELEELRRRILGPDEGVDLDLPPPEVQYALRKRALPLPMRRRSIAPFFDGRYGVPKYRRSDQEANRPEARDPEDEVFALLKMLNDLQVSPQDLRAYLSPENYGKLSSIAINDPKLEQLQFLPNNEGIEEENELPDAPKLYGWAQNPLDLPETRIYEEDDEVPEPAEYGSGAPAEIFTERKLEFLNPNANEVFRELKQKQQEEDDSFDRKWKPILYSEGGAEPENLDRLSAPSDLNLWDRYSMGFKRPERLDVKKPGPPFDPAITKPGTHPKNDLLPSMIKKEPRGANPLEGARSREVEHRQQEEEEAEEAGQYVHVEFRNVLRDWRQGKDIIRNISNLLRMEARDFVDASVNSNSVSFRVAPTNNRGYNSTDVAKRIDAMKQDFEATIGLDVVSVGVGNKIRMQHVLFTQVNPDNQFIVVSLVCGILVALIVATIVLILVRRHARSKEKLHGLNQPDSEASKDYQDLCRARMAVKGPGTDAAHDKGRITSLSRESEQSPSSRSSTSSWSEEPALHNMDISTGHMVLSYMEDHLKNKDRLDREWEALCAYVAEPCDTSIALKTPNREMNRYPEVVPYDHARVVLNELSNASGCDYINASSITDHDPRNPAYIATQGALPHTAPAFWQLIWEQGAVVIVMLSRLTEGGAAMCHRYWPEEGSELYHIYEVHLVSEHIWCDDYLVRSFYLKNVKTGETRTVTQFHFLSWPEAGVPASTKALLEFRRKVNKSYRGRSCPIVVHCSDGAGRTGTYCLIDMVLSRMAKGAKEIDIAATLEHLRDQRPRMVATKQQFEFVLTAVAEEVHAILKALPPQPSPLPQATPEKPEK
ncbi:receptor-type tyrosine-protein phosphatase N2 isoform X2 [Dendroctonus ponderosae]|nr:receptor-type tyrosine-protein phosphatase N2 isoform X2 [Dendroctonus ponderosae]XP_048518834.1 receptor-type tyrosine-protein phosphatase N2 isoform X2 [Dendroctonus ponderosae]